MPLGHTDHGHGTLSEPYWVPCDSALGLDLALMGARHYSPALGRFLQPDPSALETNPYAHAEDSPVSKVDPDGRFWVAFILVGVRITIWVAPKLYAAARSIQRVGPAATQVAIRLAPARWLKAHGWRWKPEHITHHGVPLWQIALAIARGTRFRYKHDGICKVGFFDAATRVFVATSPDKFIYTSFRARPKQISTLRANPC